MLLAQNRTGYSCLSQVFFINSSIIDFETKLIKSSTFLKKTDVDPSYQEKCSKNRIRSLHFDYIYFSVAITNLRCCPHPVFFKFDICFPKWASLDGLNSSYADARFMSNKILWRTDCCDYFLTGESLVNAFITRLANGIMFAYWISDEYRGYRLLHIRFVVLQI